MRRAAPAVAFACLPLRARAHGAEIHSLADLPHAYTLDPLVLVPMAIVAVVYAAGVARVWRTAGRGHGIAEWRVLAFILGMLALCLALIWPLDALGGAALSAHMAQHVTLTAFAAPLLAASAPIVASLWAMPRAWRRAAGTFGRRFAAAPRRLVTLPLVAWLGYASMLWIWHMPGPYQAAVEDDTLHRIEHVAFFASALLLWWTAFLSVRSPAIGLGSGIFLLFATCLQEGLLGAVLTFSGRTLYAVYDTTPGLWGVTPLEDQQLAGLMMWLPGGAVYLCGGVVLSSVWLRRLAARSAASQRGTWRLQASRPLSGLAPDSRAAPCPSASGGSRSRGSA